MIVLNNLTKNFNNQTIFSGLNLSFKKGKITAILGSSGVGKTTLLNILSGLESFSGEILNKPLKISYAFQNPSLIENLTVEENILLVNSTASKEELNYLLKALNIENLASKQAKNLSFGEKQRVNFIRALLFNGELLLVDENFSSLDVKTKLSAEKLLKEYKEKKNLTVIIVTHDLSLATSIADDIVVLFNKGGNIVSTKIEVESERGRLKEKLLNIFEV